MNFTDALKNWCDPSATSGDKYEAARATVAGMTAYWRALRDLMSESHGYFSGFGVDFMVSYGPVLESFARLGTHPSNESFNAWTQNVRAMQAALNGPFLFMGVMPGNPWMAGPGLYLEALRRS